MEKGCSAVLTDSSVSVISYISYLPIIRTPLQDEQFVPVVLARVECTLRAKSTTFSRTCTTEPLGTVCFLLNSCSLPSELFVKTSTIFETLRDSSGQLRISSKSSSDFFTVQIIFTIGVLASLGWLVLMY